MKPAIVRNVFDQYSQPENRVTHALACTLAAEPALLRDFLTHVVGIKPPAKAILAVVEQRLPGDPEPIEEDPERRGLPDMVIHDGESWAVAFEAKVAATLTRNQIERHRKTLAKRGFDSISMVALDVIDHEGKPWPGVRFVQWADVYAWAKAKDSSWARTLAEFLEVTEIRLIESGYLKEGALTKFAGIPFGPDYPYNYGEAKRLLRLAMQELRKDKRLAKELGANLRAPGRSAITGKATNRVWDYIPLKIANEAKLHTSYPHLSLDIGPDETRAYISLPNGLRPDIRKRYLVAGIEGFRGIVETMLMTLAPEFRDTAGAEPFCYIGQRRYPSQRANALVDAELVFDPRTAFPDLSWPAKPKIKQQIQWLLAAFAVLENKRSNVHFSFGMKFDHARCTAIANPDAIRMIANAWIGCGVLTDLARHTMY